jgi:ATP-dependent exoDNAse (exonuclease V) alpha subunit
MARRSRNTTPGEMSFLWLNGVRAKGSNFVVGSVRHRANFESWSNYLLSGLRSLEFLKEVQAQPDAWSRARAVGQRVSQLAANYRELSDEQKQELARETETELKTGAKLLNEDKKQILEIVASAADP